MHHMIIAKNIIISENFEIIYSSKFHSELLDFLSPEIHLVISMVKKHR